MLRAAQTSDVFFAPLVRTAENRRKGSGLPGPYLYADLDRELDGEQQVLLDNLVSRPGSFLSCAGRGRHLYVLLARVPGSLEVFVELNRRPRLRAGGGCEVG